MGDRFMDSKNQTGYSSIVSSIERNTMHPKRDAYTILPKINQNMGLSKHQNKNIKHLKSVYKNLNQTDISIKCMPKTIQIKSQ